MTRAFLYIFGSFVWLFGGAFAVQIFADEKGVVPDHVMWALLFGFVAIFLTGTSLWAKAKGYHPMLGFVLGWIGPVGLLVLVFLQNQSKPASAPASEAS